MNIFSKIVNQNPETLLGKAMENFKREMGPLSFIIYMFPLIVLIIINEINNPGTQIPLIYSGLIIWYFVSLILIDRIKKKNNVTSEIIQMVICFPLYLSVLISYFVIRIFINKKKYPNVTEDKLPLVQRNIKLKKIKKKIKKKKIFS